MCSASASVIKRDGSREAFRISKVKQAIEKACKATGIAIEQVNVSAVVKAVEVLLASKGEAGIEVEEIQDVVEHELMRYAPEVAKRYIIYREKRTVEREKRTSLKRTMDGIVSIESNDVNLSNANMSAHTPSGQMMTFASEVTKDYALKYLLSSRFARAHQMGDIHIHDLDYYPTKTATCVQYDLEELFERGFKTKNGSIRTPQSIQSYATLATIVFQTNQNEQHGGQAIPAFDFFMAPGVRKSFHKHLSERLQLLIELDPSVGAFTSTQIREYIAELNPSLEVSQDEAERLVSGLRAYRIECSVDQLMVLLSSAYQKTKKDTYQAMEGFIHNLNTMHSRGGNQVVFSSINYGTDTSSEGRMVVRELLRATVDGLGKGEIPIFPIQIFKVKEGVNYSDEDYTLAYSNLDDALAGKLKFQTPNFDLLLESCKTTAHALFPNFVFLDTEYNKSEAWRADDPKRYLHEVATMGCRTRVFDNVNGLKSSVGRGNLSFTTMNLPRIALNSVRELKSSAGSMGAVEELKTIFLRRVREMATLIAEQLYDRYQYQRTALARQFPFMMSNNIWKGGEALSPNQEVGDVWKSGTLGIGFIGGHNAMVALYGVGHGSDDVAWQTLYDAVAVMKEVADEFKERYQLNYSVLATPAEGLSGRFTRLDRKRYGSIKGVNDLDYYVNSFHVDVKESIGMYDKIRKEAPFHNLTRGGHISYIELDGEAKKNVAVILKLVKVMKDEQIGYGSINHPVDTCKGCGYRGTIYHTCPLCKGEDIARLRRITGYLTGTLDSWNSAKQAEERDRVKHK